MNIFSHQLEGAGSHGPYASGLGKTIRVDDRIKHLCLVLRPPLLLSGHLVGSSAMPSQSGFLLVRFIQYIMIVLVTFGKSNSVETTVSNVER